MKREIKEIRRGFDGMDGAGVKLVRVLSSATTKHLDPFLMLDVFDSDNPEDYIKGFPMHPHRGIETITYLIEGEMIHRDSIGNQGSILPGGTQWMTAGSGIMHEEMPQPSPRMMGFQLWLNMPAKDKMQPPAYREVNRDNLPEYQADGITVRVISGNFKGVAGGVVPDYLKPEIYFVDLPQEQTFNLQTPEDDTVFIYIFRGSLTDGQQVVEQKNGILFEAGSEVNVTAGQNARFLYIQGPKLEEPIAWGGPIVMNTKEELNQAFAELREGSFLKTKEVEGTETLNK